jgi:hypothetical protein
MALKRTDEQWLALLREYQASGLSQQQFCQQRGIPHSTFSGNKIRLQKRNIPPKPRFISITPPPLAEPSITMTLTVGLAHLDFSSLPPPDYVAQLLRALSS